MFGDVPVLTHAGLSHLIVEVVDEWNAHRIEAWAESPLERWAAQDALRPLEIIEPEDLARASLVAADPRKVTGKGISFNGLTYGAAELSAPRMRGKQVLIATYPGITEFIEVFFEGDWFCRATIRHLATDAERATAQQHRQTLRDRSVRASKRTEELRQVRAANANAAPDVFELITPASALVMTSDVAADGTLAPQNDSTPGAGSRSRLRDQSISGMSDADEVVANFILKATGHSPAGTAAAGTPPAKKASKPRTPKPSTAPAKKRGAPRERRDGDGHDDERGAA